MIVDLATYRRTGKIVERVPIQHTSFTPGADVRHQFASHYPAHSDPRPQQIADAFKAFAEAMAGNRPGDTEPAA